MSTATQPSTHAAPTRPATPDQTSRSAARTTRPSGWYDPDAAAWESASPSVFETARATTPDPARDTRPPIIVRAAEEPGA